MEVVKGGELQRKPANCATLNLTERRWQNKRENKNGDRCLIINIITPYLTAKKRKELNHESDRQI